VIASVGYYLRLLTYRQAVLAPALAYLGLVAVNYASPAGPPLRAGAVTIAGLMPVTAWLAWLTATAESTPFGEITLVVTGGPVRRQVARSVATLSLATVFAVVSTVWGVLVNAEPFPLSAVAALLGLHLAEACAGAGAGLLAAPPLHRRPGLAVAGVTLLTVASLTVPWLPPLNPVLRATLRTPPPGTPLILTVIGQAAVAGGACWAAAALATRLRHR
jgi:hypothetical protein